MASHVGRGIRGFNLRCPWVCVLHSYELLTLVCSDCYNEPTKLFMHPRPLILSFELKFFVCRHLSIWGFQNRVCLYPDWRNHHSFVNISPALGPALVIDTSMERYSQVLQHGNSKILLKKFEIRILTCILTWAEELKSP